MLRALLARYFEQMRGVESHGGSVEKFIGDAVMAVFGIAQASGPARDRGRGELRDFDAVARRFRQRHNWQAGDC